MIKLFVTDLDGCISHPFETPSWKAINEIRELNLNSRTETHIPPLTICTGRPYPYAEAVGQWLDVRLPFVFESAGLYHWDGNRIETGLDSLDGALEPIRELKKWLSGELLPNYPNAALEFTKMMDAGVVCPDASIIDEIHQHVLNKLDSGFPNLEVHTTDVSVNILMPGNNKARGLQLLGASLGVDLQEMAYIGDTGGDVPALKKVKLPFSPNNARDIAKAHSVMLPFETTDAVLEAYKRVIAFNKEEMEGERS